MALRKKTNRIGENKSKLDILQAAAKIFADQGVDGASIRVIAQKAGTTHGMIRYYFGTKEDLWKAVLEYLINQFVISQVPVLEQMKDIDPVQLLKSYVRNFVHVSAKYPELGKIILNEGSSGGKRIEYIVNHILPPYQLLDPVFLEVQKKGFLLNYTHNQFFFFLVATGMGPMCLSSLVDAFCGGEILSEEGVRAHADLVIATLFSKQEKVN